MLKSYNGNTVETNFTTVQQTKATHSSLQRMSNSTATPTTKKKKVADDEEEAGDVESGGDAPNAGHPCPAT